MDELEKKELDAASEDEQQVASEDEVSDELVKELEDIRDMFQQAIDNAGEASESSGEVEGELIQELDEEEDSDEAYLKQEEKKICDCCGEEFTVSRENEDYPYCENCRELMKRYPLRAGGIIAILAAIVLFGLSFYLGSGKLESALQVLEIQEQLASDHVFSAVENAYAFVGNSTSTDSKKAEKLLIESYYRAGYVTDAAEFIEKVYSESQLKMPWNKKYKDIVESVESFTNTKTKADEIVSPAFTGSEYDYEEVIAALDKLMKTPVSEDSDETYNVAFISYYKAEIMRLHGESPEDQFEVLNSVDEDEKEKYNWIYLPALCATAGKSGNEELAREYFEKIKDINIQDMNAYISFANYYRFLEKPDGAAILELCDEARNHAYSGDNTYYPTMAMAYLINGEGALALETMQEYMNSSRYTVSNCNLYALCGLYCGNDEIYDNMKSTLESAGYELSPLVEDYKAGKLTIEQVIADKGGEVY